MAITLSAFFWGHLPAQDSTGAAVEKAFSEVPDRFFQVQDSFGFFWEVAPNGALTSGETQYLQSGLNLLVDEKPFAPSAGSALPPGDGVETVKLFLEEKREGVEISREVWFDQERGGVRVSDQFKNTSGKTLTIPVKLRTTYPFAWKSLHGSNGGQLNAAPILTLQDEDGGLSVRFGPSEGRPDTLILASDGNAQNRPALEASANRRELVLAYEISLDPGETKSLFHWVLQRSLAAPTETAGAFADFWQRGKLIRPGVSADLAAEFLNFDREAFPAESVLPSRLRSLIALNELIDRVGIHRRGEELLWISTANQIAGEVDVEGALEFSSAHRGLQKIPLSSVAAIKGAGGFGRTQLVYLRDGSVLSGRGNEQEIALELSEGEAQAVDLAKLNLLLFRTSKEDGLAPEKSEVFVELRDGAVMALAQSDQHVLKGATAWGGVEIPFSEVVEAGYKAHPHPRMVVRTKSGSRLSMFSQEIRLNLTLASGEEVEVPSNSLRRVWAANLDGLERMNVSSNWIELSEVPGGLPSSAFLLRGNNVISGAFADAFLELNVDGSIMQLPASQLLRIRQSQNEADSANNTFVVTLRSGDTVTGKVKTAFLEIDSAEISRISFSALLDYQKKDSD